MGVKMHSTRNKLFLMMVLQIAVWGAWQPKIFPYMGMLDFTPWQQALVGSSWGLAALVGIFFSNQFADRSFSAERFLAGSHVIGGLALAGCAFVTDFWPFFALYMLYSLVYVPTLSVANSIAFANLAEPAKDFGLVRMGGTVGWIVASWPFVFLLSANADASQVRWIFLVAAIISFGLAAYSLTLPHTPPRTDISGLDRLAWVKALRLLKTPFVLVLFLVTFIDSVIHNGYFVLSDAFLTNRVGIAGNLSMIVLSLGQVAEILTMLVLGTVLAKLGWRATMIIGILGHGARFLVFAFFPDNVPVIVAVQLVHGICYAFFFATVYIFVDAYLPKDIRSSAQGLFNLMILGGGALLANTICGDVRASYTKEGVTDWHGLFELPMYIALGAAALLAIAFHPPKVQPGADAAALPH